MIRTQTQIKQLTLKLSLLLKEIDNASLKDESTHQKIARASKTVSRLRKLGLTLDQAFDNALEFGY